MRNATERRKWPTTHIVCSEYKGDGARNELSKYTDDSVCIPNLNGNDDTLWRALNIVLADKLERIGEFAKGDPVLTVHFRVRVERAGTDWIVTDAKVRDSDRNPLYIIDQGSP